MTNEERHIAVLNRMLESMDVYDSIQPTTERKKAIKAAIKALEQQPCEDAISRQAVLDYIDKMPNELTADGRRMIRRRTLEEYISDTLPPVTPTQKYGKWIDREMYDADRWKCSECGRTEQYKENYCPNCGACMVEPQESEEQI